MKRVFIRGGNLKEWGVYSKHYGNMSILSRYYHFFYSAICLDSTFENFDLSLIFSTLYFYVKNNKKK